MARNELRASPLWARPCRAYNVQIEVDARTKASLGRLQKILQRAEPDLLLCPRESLHVSVAWLLAVHVNDYPVPKDTLWERHKKDWMADLEEISAQSAPFRLTYEHLVATDSAVIALARPTGPVNRIRAMIRERLRLPSKTRNEADLVHTTLFRYRVPLSNPEKFLTLLENTSVDITTRAEGLIVSKELVYPSLKTEVLGLARFARRES